MCMYVCVISMNSFFTDEYDDFPRTTRELKVPPVNTKRKKAKRRRLPKEITIEGKLLNRQTISEVSSIVPFTL